jgi:hypothetical protein
VYEQEEVVPAVPVPVVGLVPAAGPKCAMRGGCDECAGERRRRQEALGARGGQRRRDDNGFARGETEVSSGNPSRPRVAGGKSLHSPADRTESLGHQHLFSGSGIIWPVVFWAREWAGILLGSQSTKGGLRFLERRPMESMSRGGCVGVYVRASSFYSSYYSTHIKFNFSKIVFIN